MFVHSISFSGPRSIETKATNKITSALFNTLPSFWPRTKARINSVHFG